MRDLPRDVVASWEEGGLNCPWCGFDVSEATVTLETLLLAHSSGRTLRWAPRDFDGTAEHDALGAACPACERPFIIALQHGPCWPVMRLLAVRTDADAEFMRGRVPR